MPPKHPRTPPAAQPLRPTFDPWNSSSTGHQRAENRLAGSTAWRDSRTLKLGEQFGDGGGAGGRRVADTVGAGSVDFGRDGGRKDLGIRDLQVMLTAGGAAEREGRRRGGLGGLPAAEAGVGGEEGNGGGAGGGEGREEEGGGEEKEKKKRRVFQGLCVYVNGSTAPHVSDYRLKHLLAQHGARLSISLGRRTVTHVIVGRPSNGKPGGGGGGGGAGGGLSGSKIQKEIERVRGCGVKFVGVEWVLESIKAGKRVSEANYAVLSTAPRGVGSVVGMFERQRAKERVERKG